MTTKRCCVCGKEFIQTGINHKYCKKCSREAYNKQVQNFKIMTDIRYKEIDKIILDEDTNNLLNKCKNQIMNNGLIDK